MLPALFYTLLPVLPAGPATPLVLAAMALTYVLTRREVDAKLSIR